MSSLAARARTIDGGSGIDTVSYLTSGAGVTASLSGTAGVGGDAAGDIISNAEVLQGSAFADTLSGRTGSDTLYGDAGNDTLLGTAGADVLDGGSGTDTVDYSASASGVTVYLDGSVSSGGDAAGDMLVGVERVIGSLLNDALTGFDANLAHSEFNTNEAAGDSYTSIENPIGSAFNDRLTGDTGDNVIDGGSGNDTLAGGLGADTLTGGVGTDTADYSGATSAIGLTLGAGGTGTGTGTAGEASGDTLSGIEAILGSAFNDSFSLKLGTGFSIDGGAGVDSVALAASSGTVSASQLTGVLSHVETIDFTSSGTSANLTVDATFIQSLAGAGNASALTVHFDGNDTLNVAAVAFYAHTGNDYTFYSDASMTTQVGQLTVA